MLVEIRSRLRGNAACGTNSLFLNFLVERQTSNLVVLFGGISSIFRMIMRSVSPLTIGGKFENTCTYIVSLNVRSNTYSHGTTQTTDVFAGVLSKCGGKTSRH